MVGDGYRVILIKMTEMWLFSAVIPKCYISRLIDFSGHMQEM